MESPPELDLLRFIRETLPDADGVAIEQVAPIAGGFSHETLRLRLSYRRGGIAVSRGLVLRRQPEFGPLAPYDVVREAQVLQCLAGSDIPVPQVLWVEPAGEVIGSPFFIMEEVEGEPMPFFWRLSRPEDPRVASHVRMLRRIHETDWPALGLDFLGDPSAEPLQAEIDRCRRRASFHGAETADPFRELADWLALHAPSPYPVALLHGDPNPANYIFRGDAVAAVVDWELASLGDPRTDLGFYAAVQTVFGGEWGLPYTRFVSLYEEEARSPLSDMPYFEALGLLRMTAVLLGLQGSAVWDVREAQARVQARFREICDMWPRP